MPKLIDRKFVKDLPEITTSNYFEKKRRYHKDGLFSEYIFGLERNYTCRCGTYHGKYAEGSVCKEKCCDGLVITNSIKRRRQYAKIVLPIPVLNRTFFALMKKVFQGEKKLFSDIEMVMRDYRTIVYKNNDGELVSRRLKNDDKHSDLTFEYFTMHEAAEKILYSYIDSILLFEPDNEEVLLLRKHIKDHFFINEIIVIPPALRPISQINPNTNSVDQINQYYYQLLVRKEIMAAIDVDISDHLKVYQNYYYQFQLIVDELYTYIINNLSKKDGLIRGNILGKRIDFSGRAVIAPSPTIELDECILPYKMVLEFYKIKIAKKLIELGNYKFIHQALKCVEEAQFYNDPCLLPICREIVGDDVCLLNRQPSLHKLGLLAFKIKVDIVDVIYIHPLVCSGFNADFDGDSIICLITIEKCDNTRITKHISELKDTELFKIIPEKEKENISHYEPTEELHTMAISLDDGTIAKKKILDYSEHRNLKMYKIHDKKNRFEDFWVSVDHSLVVWDETENKHMKISPIELLKNKEGRYFIQQEQ